jgi:hypothetical protein
MIEREISTLKCKHDFIQLSILALEFEYDRNWLICFASTAIHYNENYYPDLGALSEESKAI